ncbi:MAG: GNAT family N-acetyltransferase [Bifidobacteriaceae bacterium]|nr:GNAT family N-acetyltransferase [Bifidobacteriaceae bacterium]
MTVMIRTAAPDEAEDVLRFYYDLIDAMKDSEYPLRWKKGMYPVLSDMSSAAEAGTLHVAVDDGRTVGAFVLNNEQNPSYDNVPWTFLAPREKIVALHLLAVDPSIQGHGLGRTLLSEAVRIAREDGNEVMRLDTLTWNLPAQKLYEGFGFHCCGDVELDYATTGVIPFRMYEYRLV